MKHTLVLLYGGVSVEHEVSILTFLSILPHIDSNNWQVIPIYYAKQHHFYIGDELTDREFYQNLDFSKLHEVTFVRRNHQIYLKDNRWYKKRIPIDGVLPLLHGTSGEDGTIQGLFETLNLPYAQSISTSCVLGQDKEIMRQLFAYHNIDQVEWTSVEREAVLNDLTSIDQIPIELPWIIKPAYGGSSIGITLAETQEDKKNKVLESLSFDRKVIIEKKLTDFHEYNLAVIQCDQQLVFSHVEEVIKSEKILSYHDKYGGSVAKNPPASKIFPAECSNELIKKMQDIIKCIYTSFHLSGIVRFDFLVQDEKLYLNELNLIPGSLALYLFDGIMTKGELLEWILSGMWKNHKTKMKEIRTIESSLLKGNLSQNILKKF